MKNKKFIVYVVVAVLAGISVLAADESMQSFGKRQGEAGWSENRDQNSDGVIDGYDLALQGIEDPDNLNSENSPKYRSDRILVKFVPRLSEEEIRIAMSSISVLPKSIVSLKGMDYKSVKVPEDRTVEAFLQQMKNHKGVKDAQYDYICRALRTPNDQYYSIQWNFEHVKAPRAWDLTLGGNSDVIVAVIDTGVAYENYNDYKQAPDLAGTNFTDGYDFINSDSHANDDAGHGTHVAGTIAQTTNNSIGTAGLAYKCTIMPIKVLGANGSGTSSSLAQGIRWAADHNANVINMSLGFPVGSNGGSAVREAIQYAYGKGLIMVAAAGNEANDHGYTEGIDYPAAHDEVIAVGAIRYDKHYTNYSNYGSAITCVAPGGKVNFDQNGDGNSDGILQQTFTGGNYTRFRYVFYEGTSSASPHVAAAAALFVARRAGGPAEFRQAIIETSEDLGSSGFDNHYGYGLIDIGKIVMKGHGWGAN